MPVAKRKAEPPVETALTHQANPPEHRVLFEVTHEMVERAQRELLGALRGAHHPEWSAAEKRVARKLTAAFDRETVERILHKATQEEIT